MVYAKKTKSFTAAHPKHCGRGTERKERNVEFTIHQERDEVHVLYCKTSPFPLPQRSSSFNPPGVACHPTLVTDVRLQTHFSTLLRPARFWPSMHWRGREASFCQRQPCVPLVPASAAARDHRQGYNAVPACPSRRGVGKAQPSKYCCMLQSLTKQLSHAKTWKFVSVHHRIVQILLYNHYILILKPLFCMIDDRYSKS